MQRSRAIGRSNQKRIFLSQCRTCPITSQLPDRSIHLQTEAVSGHPQVATNAPAHPEQALSYAVISSFSLLSDYIAKAVNKLHSLPSGASLAPKASAIDTFSQYTDEYMKTQVWTEECNCTSFPSC